MQMSAASASGKEVQRHIQLIICTDQARLFPKLGEALHKQTFVRSHLFVTNLLPRRLRSNLTNFLGTTESWGGCLGNEHQSHE